MRKYVIVYADGHPMAFVNYQSKADWGHDLASAQLFDTATDAMRAIAGRASAGRYVIPSYYSIYEVTQPNSAWVLGKAL